jgi:predicted nucleotidyltransferase
MDLKRDFEMFKDDALGILIFGSSAQMEDVERSDIDICIVRPVNGGLLTEMNRMLGGKYDIKVFENLPLYIRIEIIRDHKIIYGDEVELSAYFYRFRRLWADMVPRVEYNQFGSVEERMILRKRWLHEKKTILGEAGIF